MKSRNIIFIVIVALGLGAGVLRLYQNKNTTPQEVPSIEKKDNVKQTQGDHWETKIDEQGAVTVSVTPLDLPDTSPEWKFAVTMDTHSIDLSDDMVASALLIGNEGNEYKPLRWEGDLGGGHHRKGVLTFPTPTPLPAQIELRMKGVGGVSIRTFTWEGERFGSKEIFRRPETDYDFGVVKQSGGIVQHEFSFTYQGIEPLSVVGVPTSCSCTLATIDKNELERGDSATITVSFDPNLHEEPTGKFFKTISLKTLPQLPNAPEWKIWAEIDLDLGPEAYKLKQHKDEQED